ncbi:MAG: hypothetical protein K8T25_13540 [Planctomycetia bacterium]|nr:hypothetical protein [Planctomycetia bacterium]
MAANTSDAGGAAPETAEIVDLRNPLLAALLALLWPGLGHLYQRRIGKSLLFMVCILGTYTYGWFLGGEKVVYASWNPPQMRHYGYLCQVWVGLPAWPAMVQSALGSPLGPNFMAPPRIHTNSEGDNDLAIWNREYPTFELGSVLTMVAGLLNVLVIFDAAAGPVGSTETEPEETAGKRGPPRPKAANTGGG